MDTIDTQIVFFGGAVNPPALEAIVKLKQAGFDVIDAQHDSREAAVLRTVGIPHIADRATAVNECQVVVSSCATSAEVEDLYLGDDGLLELLDSGTVCIDASFSSPRLAREIQALAATRDIFFIDAPITALGEKEESLVFVGGDAQAREEASPLFPYLAHKVVLQDGPGAGQMAALVAYVGLAGSIMGTVEAISIGHIAGFAGSDAVNALASTSAGSRALVDYAPKMLLHDYDGRIDVHRFLDALDVVLDLAEECDVSVPLVETVYQLSELLSTVGGDNLNIQALALLYEDEETCARYGLDWALADEEYYDDEDGEDFDLEEFLRANLGGRGIGRHGSADDAPSASGGFFSKN